MPFELRNIKKDLDDIGSKFDGAPDWSSARRPRRSGWRNPASATSASRPAIAFPTATRTESKRRCTWSCGGAGG